MAKQTKNLFVTPALLPDNGIKSNADKGFSLLFKTQEINPESGAELLRLKGKFGHLLFLTDDAKLEQAKELIQESDFTEFPGEKSMSQQLRDVLWHLWNQGNKNLEWEVFYRLQMRRFIDAIKEKLN